MLIFWGAVIEHGFTGQSWLTFRQALGLGGHVRKGERGTTVVYADRFTPDDERRRAAETGEEAQAIPFLKRFTVFNTAQCEGLPDEMTAMAPPVETDLVLPQAEALIRATGVDFRIGGERAFYDPRHDFVQVPPPQAYFEPINWHRIALHEISHASGHTSRLNRDLTGSFGSKKYAFEELIAEISAAYLCASLNITPTVRHADYIGSWLDVLRENCANCARRQRRVEGGGLHPGVPVRNSRGRRGNRGRRRKWRRPDGGCRLPGFSCTGKSDIRAPALPAFRVCGLARVRGLRRFRDEVGSRERLSAARHGENRHGDDHSKNHPQRLARYPLQQVGVEPGERPARQGRRLDR